jgi:hypothetical protein
MNNDNNNSLVFWGFLLIIVAAILFFNAPSSTITEWDNSGLIGQAVYKNNPEYTTFMIGAALSGVLGVLLIFAGFNAQNQEKLKIQVVQEKEKIENEKVNKLSQNIEKQLQDIKNLYDKNIINDEEYQKLRNKIIEKS